MARGGESPQGEGEGPAPAFAGQPRRQQPMRPWRGVSLGESARWCGRGPGRVRRHLGQLGMELRELLMAETKRSASAWDPARITLAAGRLLPGASCDRDEQVTVPQPWIWNESPGAPGLDAGPLPWSSRTPGESAATSGSHALEGRMENAHRAADLARRHRQLLRPLGETDQNVRCAGFKRTAFVLAGMRMVPWTPRPCGPGAPRRPECSRSEERRVG